MPQKLGIKVFYYNLSRKILIGLALLVVSIFISSSSKFLISIISVLFPINISIVIFNYLIGSLFVVAFLFLIGGIVISWLEYISCTFLLAENSFTISRGILNKKEVSIPYRQVQDVNIEQTLSHRMLGVSKFVVLTAGDDDNDKNGESGGIFEVIDLKIATGLRDEILKRTNVQMVREIKS